MTGTTGRADGRENRGNGDDGEHQPQGTHSGEQGEQGELEASGVVGAGAAQVAAGESAQVRLVVDFTRLQRHPDGTTSIVVGAVTAPALSGLGLHEGMRAVFEEPGELQMIGVLHRRAAGASVPGADADDGSGARDMHRDVGTDLWEGELDRHSTAYHVRVEPLTLYYAGPEGCRHYGEWVEVANTAASATAEAALPPTGSADSAGGASPSPYSRQPLHPPLATRPRWPARQLTLGVEGTYDQWHRPLAHPTVYGEAALIEGERVVLVDEAREVDAAVRVLRLPPDGPDGDYPAGRRVWLAEPDWGTVRPNPHPFHCIPTL